MRKIGAAGDCVVSVVFSCNGASTTDGAVGAGGAAVSGGDEGEAEGAVGVGPEVDGGVGVSSCAVGLVEGVGSVAAAL